MDWFTPLTPKFDVQKANASRAKGHQVWWYICCGPHAPHANMFIECQPIEARILMGAMTTRMRPDGFLYYQISIWNSTKCITSGPFTDWNPRSWTTYHGDGAWNPIKNRLINILRNFSSLFLFCRIRALNQIALGPKPIRLASFPVGISAPSACINYLCHHQLYDFIRVIPLLNPRL